MATPNELAVIGPKAVVEATRGVKKALATITASPATFATAHTFCTVAPERTPR